MAMTCGQPITATANMPIIWSSIDSTTDTATTNTYVAKRVAQLTLPARSIIFAIVLECELYGEGAATAQAIVSMAGGAITTPETDAETSETWVTHKVMGFIPTTLTSAYWRETETTIDFNVMLRDPAATGTGRMRNNRVGVMYCLGYEIDDSPYITGT